MLLHLHRFVENNKHIPTSKIDCKGGKADLIRCTHIYEGTTKTRTKSENLSKKMYYKTKPCNKATASKVSACKKTRSAAMVMDPEYENNSHEDEETFLSDCFPSLEDTTAFYSTSTAASATAAFPAAATLNKQAVAATGATSNTAPRSTSPSLPTTKLTKTTSIDPMTPLLPTFVPGEYDVICGRGAKAKHHIGNINFRKHLQQCISEYKQADTKLDKTLVVSDIVEWVRSKSPNGGFVKQVPNNDNGAWFEVGDQLVRSLLLFLL